MTKSLSEKAEQILNRFEKELEVNSLFKWVTIARKEIETGEIMTPEKAIER